jgi:outer membrane protein TolC
MTTWKKRLLFVGTSLSVTAGCATTDPAIPIAGHQPVLSFSKPAAKPPTPAAGKPAAAEIQLASSQESKPAEASGAVRPAYGQLETLPIDLPTVLRLVDEKSPAVGVAQARVREAQARLDLAEVQWLPHLSVGAAYTRFDGQTQNQRGEIFSVSRANLFAGGGPALALDFAEAIYRPLVERRATAAEAFRAEAVAQSTELDAAVAYLDLVQLHAQLEINADTLAKAEAMLAAAENARAAKLDRSAGDVQRAQSEVLLRRTERIDLEGRVGAASARLGRLLLLQPNVRLVPADAAVVPVPLISPTATLDELVATAIQHRPDLAANREAIAAAWQRVRRAERGPLFPKLTVANQTGTFGGGLNDDLQRFDARNALSVQLFWEVRNLGLGNRFDADERRAVLDQAQYQLLDVQARASAEIVEAAQLAAAKYESLDLAERAVKEATELYRINKEGTMNVVDAKNLFDALRPLQAIQVLNQARLNYLNAVIDFNKAQIRLFTAMGNPPRLAANGGA